MQCRCYLSSRFAARIFLVRPRHLATLIVREPPVSAAEIFLLPHGGFLSSRTNVFPFPRKVPLQTFSFPWLEIFLFQVGAAAQRRAQFPLSARLDCRTPLSPCGGRKDLKAAPPLGPVLRLFGVSGVGSPPPLRSFFPPAPAAQSFFCTPNKVDHVPPPPLFPPNTTWLFRFQL